MKKTPARESGAPAAKRSPRKKKGAEEKEVSLPTTTVAAEPVVPVQRATTYQPVVTRRDGDPDPRRTLAIRNANVHNLRNVSIELPRNRLIVMSGVSGS